MTSESVTESVTDSGTSESLPLASEDRVEQDSVPVDESEAAVQPPDEVVCAAVLEDEFLDSDLPEFEPSDQPAEFQPAVPSQEVALPALSYAEQRDLLAAMRADVCAGNLDQAWAKFSANRARLVSESGSDAQAVHAELMLVGQAVDYYLHHAVPASPHR